MGVLIHTHPAGVTSVGCSSETCALSLPKSPFSLPHTTTKLMAKAIALTVDTLLVSIFPCYLLCVCVYLFARYSGKMSRQEGMSLINETCQNVVRAGAERAPSTMFVRGLRLVATHGILRGIPKYRRCSGLQLVAADSVSIHETLCPDCVA